MKLGRNIPSKETVQIIDSIKKYNGLIPHCALKTPATRTPNGIDRLIINSRTDDTFPIYSFGTVCRMIIHLKDCDSLPSKTSVKIAKRITPNAIEVKPQIFKSVLALNVSIPPKVSLEKKTFTKTRYHVKIFTYTKKCIILP